jgi:hypothetical protein
MCALAPAGVGRFGAFRFWGGVGCPADFDTFVLEDGQSPGFARSGGAALVLYASPPAAVWPVHVVASIFSAFLVPSLTSPS